MTEDEDLVAVAMLPSYERLVWIHRQLSSGKSLLSVEQLVRNLQDDFERRNAALDRALHLLRTVWDESSHGTEVVSREANFANLWNDVLRWVNDEEKDTVSEDEAKSLARAYVDDPAAQKRWQDMVDRYAGSMSNVDWREMDESNRFRTFTDKELDELRYAVIARSELYGLYPPLRQLAAGLADEIEAEIKRRREEEAAPTYRGPGCYTDRRNGTTLHVIGRAMIDGEAHLLIGSSLEDPDMWTLPANHIEGRDIKGDRLFNFGEYT